MNETASSDSLKLLPDYLVSFKSLLETEDLFFILQKNEDLLLSLVSFL